MVMTAPPHGKAEGGRIFRFAPSPNGHLHLGHAYSALLNQKLARACGGRLLLRIEDIDPERSRRAFETALLEDLDWLGVSWSEAPRRQSAHTADYGAALDNLVDRALAYPCFCSRSDIARVGAEKRDYPRDPDGALLYPGTCRALTAEDSAARIASGARFSLRLDMARAMASAEAEAAAPLTYREFHEGDVAIEMLAAPEDWGDALIGRRDVPASYHIACVLDDHSQGVTDVVRGLDLEKATGLHRLIQALLGLKTPDYRHHRLVLDKNGRKLAKSKDSPSLRELRASGFSAADIRAELSRRMGIVF